MSTDFVKQSLRDNLARVLVPHVADGLWSIYDNALQACQRNNQLDKTLQTFQNLLTRVPQWGDEILRKEVERIILASKCEYLEDLLLGVFVSYIRAFASLQHSETTHVNVNFERPSLESFVHGFYKLAARKSWTAAYLFKTVGVSSEQQARNRRDIEKMLEDVLSQTIDGFIPWREISKAYFQSTSEAAPAPAPAPEPAKPVQFEEKKNEVYEFETDNESSDEEEEEDDTPPRIQLGEDIKLDDIEEDRSSVATEDELESKLKNAETVSLNL